MNCKIISCGVFKQELEQIAPDADIEFQELGEHAHPDTLRGKLQSRLDAATGCDAVLLAYGLCGRATDGLTAKHCPVVLPRSHDCCGILLGSRKRFEEIFKPMPSTPFASVGFAESGDYFFKDGELTLGNAYAELVAEYGEDDAKYVWEAMHPKLDGKLQPVYFIHTVPDPAAVEKCRAKAAEEERDFRELDGDLRLLKMLLAGDWPEDEFLVVPPGRTIRQVGDWNEIIRSCRACPENGHS